jgi:hypothetical protein
MRVWIGKAIMAIGVLHSMVGVLAFRTRLGELAREGLVNTIDGSDERDYAFWFIVCGILLTILGAVVNWAERTGLPFPRFLGWAVFFFASAVVLVMPVSGAWLLLVPAVGAIHRSSAARRSVRS